MSKLYRRICEMNIGGRLLQSPPMTLEFEYEFSVKGISNAKARVYNPAPETVAVAQKDTAVIITAGYEEDYGTCFTGNILKFEYIPGRDSKLEMVLGDGTALWNSIIISKSWTGPVIAKTVVSDLLSSVGVKAAKLEFTDNTNYERGISFNGVTLNKALTRIAKDTRSELYFRYGQICYLSPNKGYGTAFVLSPSTGLLTAGQTEKGYKIQTLFNYRLGAGSLVQLEKDSGVALLKLTKGKHVFSPCGNTGTEFEAVRI